MHNPFTPFVDNYHQKKTAVFFEKMASFFKKTAVFQVKCLGVCFKTSFSFFLLLN